MHFRHLTADTKVPSSVGSWNLRACNIICKGGIYPLYSGSRCNQISRSSGCRISCKYLITQVDKSAFFKWHWIV